MQRNFDAEIYIKLSKETKKLVSINPFSDSDKHIASVLEKVINQALIHDGEIYDYNIDDYFRRLTSEIR
jgi:hypothetical protein